MTHTAKTLFVAAVSTLVLAAGDSSLAASSASEETRRGDAAGGEPSEDEPKHIVLIGDSNMWYWERPFAPHRIMENMLEDLPWLNKTWLNAKVHNLAISATRPYDWIVEKKCIEGSKGGRYPIIRQCDEIEFLAEGITRVVPEPDVVIVSLGLNSIRRASPKEAVDHLAALKEYLGKIAPRVIMAAPFPMPREPHREFVAAIRQEMLDRDLLDWDWPELQFQANDTKVHLTERSRAVTGALMAIWLVYGSPPPKGAAQQPAKVKSLKEILSESAKKSAQAKKRRKKRKAAMRKGQPVPTSDGGPVASEP